MELSRERCFSLQAWTFECSGNLGYVSFACPVDNRIHNKGVVGRII